MFFPSSNHHNESTLSRQAAQSRVKKGTKSAWHQKFVTVDVDEELL